MKKKTLLPTGIAIILVSAILISIFISLNDQKNSKNEKFKIAYICKQLSNSWFQQVSKGIENSCKKYDIEYLPLDAEYNDEKCIQFVDDAINWGADGILICTTNQELGPVIAEKCVKASVNLVTIDDSMKDKNGMQLPHIGMATTELCILGGTALAKLANEKGFFDEGNIVGVIQIDVPTLSVIGERLVGYREALKAQTPLKEKDFIIIESSTGMIKENLPKVKEALKKYTKITHWIITGVNDESAIAPLWILRENGVLDKNIIACGLGLSSRDEVKSEFLKGNKNYITIAAQPEVEGQKGVDMIYENLVNGTRFKTVTVLGGQIITCDNYKIFMEN